MARVSEIFQIGPTERALLVGKTGCGKSTLCHSLLASCANIVSIDPKGEFDIPGAIVVTKPDDFRKLKNVDGAPISYQPEPEFWTVDHYDSVFLWIYLRKNTTCYIDELYGVQRNKLFPEYLQAILTRGRSRRIRTIMCTQRPFSIPISTLSEAEHYFMFELNLRDDKKRMAELMGEEVLTPLNDEHNFYYRYVKSRDTVKQCNLQLRKG